MAVISHRQGVGFNQRSREVIWDSTSLSSRCFQGNLLLVMNTPRQKLLGSMKNFMLT